MCFSPEADVIAGVVVSGVGVDAIRNLKHRRELALAALPVVFGLHQMIESLAWWGLEGQIPESIGEYAANTYLVIAFLLPVAVPVAVALAEPVERRRRAMRPFIVIGAGVSTVLLGEMLGGPVTASVACRYIEYDVDLAFGGMTTAFYVVATCVPLFMSSSRRIVLFGAANLVAVVALAWLQGGGVISLWCAWAAVASIVIATHVRSSPDRTVEPASAIRRSQLHR